MMLSRARAVVSRLKKKLQKDPDRFLRDISGVVHVGANIGQERHLYEAHGLDVIWVEPIPEVFAELSANIRHLARQRAFQALVTDVDGGEHEFHIANNGGASSSILAFDLHKDIWPEVCYTTSIRLRGVTLTTLFKTEQIDPARYQALIMDTQGSELMVLRGSIPLLKHFRFIQTEVPDFEAYAGCCQLPEVDAFMAEHGFREMSRRKFASRDAGGSYFDIVYERRG